MKLSLGALLLFSSANTGGGVAAFAPPSSQQHHHHQRSSSYLSISSSLSSTPPTSANGGDDAPGAGAKKVLTAADVIAKGTAGNLSDPDFQEAPKIYSPSIYDDFQSALLTLEKRAKDGKGSLTMTDVQTFDEETRRIVGEMKEYMDDPRGCAERITKMYGGDVLEAKKVQPGDYMEVPKQGECELICEDLHIIRFPSSLSTILLLF